MDVPKNPWPQRVASGVGSIRRRRGLARALTLALVAIAVAACDRAIEPELAVPDPYPASFWAGPQQGVGNADDPRGHDPRALVFEDLGPPEDILKGLGNGKCVMHYRRWNGKYTPIPFKLEFSTEARVPGQPARLVYRLLGGDQINVRAVCRFPPSEVARQEAAQQLRDRARAPAFVRDAHGKLQLHEPGKGSVSTAGRTGPGAAREGLFRAFWASLAGMLPFPTPLHAAQEEDCVINNSIDNPCQIDDIEVIVNDQDCGPDAYWDYGTETCVCWSGELFPECFRDEWDDYDPVDPPTVDDPYDGGDSDSSDGSRDDGEDSDYECGDERDIVAAEYERYGVNWRPDCDVFVSYGGSSHFGWHELNGGWAGGNGHPYWGYVSGGLVRGLEATRANYARGGIRLSSGYRCPHGNWSVRGASNSYHMYGRAADLYSASYTWTEQEFDIMRRAADLTSPRPVELKFWSSYPDHHLHAAW